MLLDKFKIISQHKTVCPSELEFGNLYLCEDEKLFAFLCPCGCKNMHFLPFNIGWQVFRKVKEGNLLVTVSPPLNHSGCGAQYKIIDNLILT